MDNLNNRDKAKLIAYKVRNFFHYEKNCSIVIPNTFALYGTLESDVLAFNKNNFTHEVEIKVSKTDFKKDFQKVTNAKWDRLIPQDSKSRKFFPASENKHDLIQKKLGPSYFWFAVPKDLISVEDIPDYAGLLYVYTKKDSYYGRNVVVVDMVKDAPKIHKVKASDELINKSLLSTMYKYWNSKKAHWDNIINPKST